MATKDDNLVVFGKYDTAVDANIVKGVLETNGIPAGVIGDSVANALLLNPMCVVVFAKDLDRAREVMSAPIDDEALPSQGDN